MRKHTKSVHSSLCRAKDPSVCRHHGSPAILEAAINTAADNGNFAEYEKLRKSKELAEAATSRPDSPYPKSLPLAATVNFQPLHETRRLAEGISLHLEEHKAQSLKNIEARNFSPAQRLALGGYVGFAAGTANIALLQNEITPERLEGNSPPWRETSTGPAGFSTPEEMVDYINVLDTVLSEREDKQRVLYRGIPIYKEMHEEMERTMGEEFSATDTEKVLKGLEEYYKPGKVLEFPNYLSTTHSAYVAGERTDNIAGTAIDVYERPEVRGIVLELKTNAGLDITGVARHYANEREVLLPRNTHFRVESITLQPETYSTVSGYDYSPDEIEKDDYKGIAAVVQLVEVDSEGKEITHTAPHEAGQLNLS